MTSFTPLSATIGGLLIGLSAGLLWLLNGRTAGISGIFGGLLPLRSRDTVWRVAFLIALPVGAILGTWLGPKLFSEIAAGTPSLGLAPIVAVGAGLLVGVGTKLGGGRVAVPFRMPRKLSCLARCSMISRLISSGVQSLLSLS